MLGGRLLQYLVGLMELGRGRERRGARPQRFW